ncbi:MAG: phosphate ABC transporter substrate-binding protein [Lawsonibacter sp.]|nr:phosphate ABC transporter substrate-binding protein [Lawsonibacter sp.]
MKKFASLMVAAVLALSVMAGCSQKTSGTVTTDGSTSMEKVIGALGEAFEVENSGVTFTYNPTGSGSGIQAVLEGRCDIGLSSRNLKGEESAQGLTGTVLAYDGIAVIVNPDNPVAGSGTRDGFESITGTADNCQYRQELTSTGDVITAVSQNPDAIGYASLASVKDTVRAVTVGGVAPTEDTVKDGSYVIQRPFVLVTKTDTPLSEAAQKFFDFAISLDAAGLISCAGAVAAN